MPPPPLPPRPAAADLFVLLDRLRFDTVFGDLRPLLRTIRDLTLFVPFDARALAEGRTRLLTRDDDDRLLAFTDAERARAFFAGTGAAVAPTPLPGQQVAASAQAMGMRSLALNPGSPEGEKFWLPPHLFGVVAAGYTTGHDVRTPAPGGGAQGVPPVAPVPEAVLGAWRAALPAGAAAYWHGLVAPPDEYAYAVALDVPHGRFMAVREAVEEAWVRGRCAILPLHVFDLATLPGAAAVRAHGQRL